jgi:hypothetical protein
MTTRASSRPSTPWPTISSGASPCTAGDGVLRRGGQGQQHALLAEAIRHRQQPRARDDDARRGAAEQAVTSP